MRHTKIILHQASLASVSHPGAMTITSCMFCDANVFNQNTNDFDTVLSSATENTHYTPLCKQETVQGAPRAPTDVSR